MKKLLNTLCLVAASGCATIVSRSDYDIAVECNSPGATVNIYKNDELVASTVAPSIITLPAKGGYFRPASYRFEFLKNGCKDEVDIRAEFDWWYVGNAVLPWGLVFALAVDPVTGAMWKFEEGASVYGSIQANEPDCVQSPLRHPGTKSDMPSPAAGQTGSPSLVARPARLASPVLRPAESPADTVSNAPPQMIEIDSIAL